MLNKTNVRIMAKAKWFKFDVQDFLTGTSKMTNTEIGAYIKLLLYQFDKGSVPASEEEIEEITDMKITKLTKVLKKFETADNGQLINIRMSKTRIEANSFFEKQASNGSKGGKPKKNEPKTEPMGNPWLTHGKPTANPNESHIDKIRIDKEVDNTIVDDDDDSAGGQEKTEGSGNDTGTVTPPLNVPPPEPFQPISEILEIFKSPAYGNTRQQLCIKYHLKSEQELIQKAIDFNLSLTCEGVSTKQKSNWIRHFNYWIPKAVKTNNNINPQTGKRGLVI